MKRSIGIACVLMASVSACDTDRISNTTPETGAVGSLVNDQEAMQEPLLRMVAVPTLTEKQAELVSRVRGRSTTSEVHIARIAATASSRLQAAGVILLQLSPTAQVVATGRVGYERSTGFTLWSGSVQSDGGQVQLVMGPDGITGTVQTRSGTYHIEPLGSGLHAVSRIGELPPEHPVGSTSGVLHDPPARPRPDTSTELQQSGSTTMMNSTGHGRVDVLVAYTASAAASHGNISGLISSAVQEANTTYANSAINLSIERVYAAQVSYSESGRSHPQHVSALQGTSDGMMDVVHTWRNQYKADVVVLVVNDGEACGYASTIKATQATAFAVVHYTCMTAGRYTFAHEIGHLQGARHDVYVDASTSPYPHGHGYVDPNNQWRTIMAYVNACGNCDRIGYWSNPNVSHPTTGQPLGTTSTANNAAVLEDTKFAMANFRNSVVASLSGPAEAGHGNSCSWTANVSGGLPPYTYYWSPSWSSPSTHVEVTSGQYTANTMISGYYYNSYPEYTTVTVEVWGQDAGGQTYSTQRNFTLRGYWYGCSYY